MISPYNKTKDKHNSDLQRKPPSNKGITTKTSYSFAGNYSGVRFDLVHWLSWLIDSHYTYKENGEIWKGQ